MDKQMVFSNTMLIFACYSQRADVLSFAYQANINNYIKIFTCTERLSPKQVIFSSRPIIKSKSSINNYLT